MGVREFAATRLDGQIAAFMRTLNSLHPWIRTRLPKNFARALDVRCGQVELLAALASDFDQVSRLDSDAEMRSTASRRCAGLRNVAVSESSIENIRRQHDLVTMIATRHHLDVERAIFRVRDLLRPSGRFPCVGLAPPVSPIYHLWDAVSLATNQFIGYVKIA